MEKSVVSIINPELSAEDRSYVYQQMVELAPFLSTDSSVGVIVSKDQKSYHLALVIVNSQGRIEERGSGSDLIDAAREAKSAMINKLIAIQNALITYQERSIQVDMAQHGNYLH